MKGGGQGERKGEKEEEEERKREPNPNTYHYWWWQYHTRDLIPKNPHSSTGNKPEQHYTGYTIVVTLYYIEGTTFH